MKTVPVIGGNLYTLALQYLGDATQFNRIMQANAGTSGGTPLDPFITGTMALKIPSVNPALTGGIFVY